MVKPSRQEDILVVIDPRDYQVAYEQAKAALDDARYNKQARRSMCR